jgi:hypothetical protein
MTHREAYMHKYPGFGIAAVILVLAATLFWATSNTLMARSNSFYVASTSGPFMPIRNLEPAW